MEISFDKLTNQELAGALLKQGVEEPTDIQKESIPLVIGRKDIIASSETGSGKTLAYLLPLFMMMDKDVKNPQAIVVAPTHELAVQVHKQAELLVKNSESYGWIEPAVLIGGANMQRQLEKIKRKPRIIIGSAGRILEIIRMKKMTSHFVKTIVIDEADRLLDAHSIEHMRSLIKTTLKDRQIVLFSASIEKSTLNAAQEFLRDPVVVDVRSKDKLPMSIEHICFQLEQRDKIKVLRKIVHSEKITKAIVFLSNPDNESIDTTAEKLNYHGIKSAAIYGDVQKHDRRQALLDFREGRAVLLIASDLAARGLDFKGLTHVINYDMPESPEIYLHRAGRCGRMGEKGVCISLITPREKEYINKMERSFHINIKEKIMSFGNISDITNDKNINKQRKVFKKHKEENANGRKRHQ